MQHNILVAQSAAAGFDRLVTPVVVISFSSSGHSMVERKFFLAMT
jgi:hypothetical protein